MKRIAILAALLLASPDIAALVIIPVTGTLIGVVRFLWSRP